MKPAATMTPAEGRAWIHDRLRFAGKAMSYQEIEDMFGVPEWPRRNLRHFLNEWAIDGWFVAEGSFSTRTFRAVPKEMRSTGVPNFASIGRNAPRYPSVWDYAGRAAA